MSDDDFYIYCNSNDKDAKALGVNGKRSYWRNPLPLQLILNANEWSVACVQFSLANVQHIAKRIEFMDELDSQIESSFDLPKLALDDGISAFDVVLDVAPTITSRITEDDVLVWKFESFHSRDEYAVRSNCRRFASL